VPLLAGQALAATARSFEDIAELDFRRPSQKPAEIDIIALADGRLIIGEAECVPAFGSNKEASQAIAKLTGISDLLGTDEILLATTAPRPWHERDTGLLLNEVARHSGSVRPWLTLPWYRAGCPACRPARPGRKLTEKA